MKEEEYISVDEVAKRVPAIEAATFKKLEKMCMSHMESLHGKNEDGPTHCLGQIVALLKMAIVMQQLAEHMELVVLGTKRPDRGRHRFFTLAENLWRDLHEEPR